MSDYTTVSLYTPVSVHIPVSFDVAGSDFKKGADFWRKLDIITTTKSKKLNFVMRTRPTIKEQDSRG